MPALNLSLLGTFKAELNNKPITHFRSSRVQALLIYLATESLEGIIPHQREALLDLFWTWMPTQSAQVNLRQTLYQLKKAIPEHEGHPIILTSRKTVQLNPDYPLSVDVIQFEQLLNHPPDHWAAAITLYRADFLADFFLPDADTFDTWVTQRRASFQRKMLDALANLASLEMEKGNVAQAEQYVRRQLALDELREGAHQQLMEVLARNGRRQEALSHYNTLQKLLKDELAIEPSQETRALVEAIRADSFPAKSPRPSQVSSFLSDLPEPPTHNLPRRLTSFIGREKELGEITQLISDHHLVMLTGVGGIGKTNLCLQVGQQQLEHFPDGVWLVELAPITDPQRVTQTIVNALGLRPTSNRPILDILLDYLQHKQCLLIFDNCEHVIYAAAEVLETILQVCSQLKVLASSREALGISGEMIYQVPSLIVPRTTQQTTIEEWEQFDALRLFVERGRAVLPDFQVTDDNFQTLVQICQRLDGIPLALELAAARLKILTTAQIVQRLDNRFRLLTSGRRTALLRQQTLRALIDWSWDLLSEMEQTLLQRLSVFSGGVSLEAIESVCADNHLESYEILDLLAELVNKSLVITQRKQGKETRYQLLETIRQYGQEKLTIAGDSETYRQRHLDYFLHLCQQAESELIGPDQVAWLNRLDMEMDNLRIALSWANETNPEAGLRIIVYTKQFLMERTWLQEGETWLQQLLKKTENVTPEMVAKAMCTRAEWMLWVDFKRSRLLAEEALNFSRTIDHQSGIAYSLLLLGIVTQDDKNHRNNLLQQCIALFREQEDKFGLANGTAFFASFQTNTNPNLADIYYAESEALYREIGHISGIITLQDALGQRDMWRGNLEQARLRVEEALYLRKSIGVQGTSWTLLTMGRLLYWLGEYSEAETYIEKGMSLQQHKSHLLIERWGHAFLGYIYLNIYEFKVARKEFVYALNSFQNSDIFDGVCFVLEGLACLSIALEEPEHATRLLAWVDGFRQSVGNRRPLIEETFIEGKKEVILNMIGKEAYDLLYEEGQAMTKEEAIAYAIGDESQDPHV